MNAIIRYLPGRHGSRSRGMPPLGAKGTILD